MKTVVSSNEFYRVITGFRCTCVPSVRDISFFRLALPSEFNYLSIVINKHPI